MPSPHHSLPWPRIDPDELGATSRRLRELSMSIETATNRWDPRVERWHGRSSTMHRAEMLRVRLLAAGMPAQLSAAATSIERLAHEARSARGEIASLARGLHASESRASDLRADAREAAHRADMASSRFDPVGLAESETLRYRAAHARRVADDATRQAERLRQRALDSSAALVRNLEARDSMTSHEIDGLLQHTASTWRLQLIGSHLPATRPDREWVTERINATSAAVRRHVEALAQAQAELESVPWLERTWWESMALVYLTEEIRLHRRFLAPGRQLLDWDPAADGRVVEVFGDLTTAEHVAVVVPGIMNTIKNFDDQLSSNAKELWSAAAEVDSQTAVVAWLGYDTPELLNAVTKERAVEHESDLRRFVESLPVDAHVTVVAHSYGTVLTAEAAARGLKVDDMVLVGSPGTRLDHASEADLEPGAQIFAGVSDSDYVVGRTGYGSVVCPEKAIGAGWLTPVRWIFNPVTGPISWFTDSCKTDGDGDVKGLSHGINPAHEDFGAIELDTEGVGGHSSYLDEGTSSLEAIASIVTGTHPDQH